MFVKLKKKKNIQQLVVLSDLYYFLYFFEMLNMILMRISGPHRKMIIMSHIHKNDETKTPDFFFISWKTGEFLI